jgi:RNA polymerase sigma-70 factor, ECF subfamily
MSYDEAARIVGVPIGTIMSRVARGRDALRRSMMEPSVDNPAHEGRVRHLRRVK